jgi:hypothetical protein
MNQNVHHMVFFTADVNHLTWKKKILTKAKFTSSIEKPKVSKCEDPRCGTCPFMQTSQSITFRSGMKFHVNSNMTCKSENLPYCMTCPTCGENYIGRTGNKLTDRVRVHKQQIRDPTLPNTPCSGHFDSCGNGHFRIFPFWPGCTKCIWLIEWWMPGGRASFWVPTLCNQLLPHLLADILKTLHSCYGHIEDVHVTFWKYSDIFRKISM